MAINETRAADAAQTDKRKVGRASPLKKPLPTDRITVPKQFEIVRAFAAVSGSERRPTTNRQAANLVKITPETLSLANPFLVEIGFLEKCETGIVPSAEALAFKTAVDIQDEHPEYRLAPLVRKAWFFEVIRPKLEFQSVVEAAIVADLAVFVNAEKSDLARIRQLLDYLSITGVVTRENGSLALVRATGVRENHSTNNPPKPRGEHQNHSDLEPGGRPPDAYINQLVLLPGRTEPVSIRFPRDLTEFEFKFLEHAVAGVKLYVAAQKGTTNDK
ncbi:MAG: hypothetical protein HZA53_08075 [Planctomycetes bacterium]|nr:hypothetical protein [Planctomycetota bacterium]